MSLLLLLTSALAASPWEGSCAERGRETWGTLVDVVDQASAEQTDERFNHVAVHRPLENQRLGRAVRASRAAEPGLVLCYGDWVETWRDAEVTLAEVGARALLTVRGSSLVWLDAELRHVHGIVDYYVLDAASAPDRESPVPVALGYSTTTASRQDSIFRVEVLDPASGEALITVSPDNDVFLADAAVEHGVTLSGGVRVRGGETARVRDGRLLSASEGERESAGAALADAKTALDSVAASLWDSPPAAQGWDAPKVFGHRIVLEGLAYPDHVDIDGRRLPPSSWRRVRVGGRKGLVSVGYVPIEAGLHEVVVQTWGERTELQVETDDGSARGATIEVRRDGVPRRANRSARPSWLDPYVRAERLEVRPALRLSRFMSELAYRTDPDFTSTSVSQHGQAIGAHVPARVFAHGGRYWAELAGTVDTYLPSRIEVELDFVGFPGVEPPPALVRFGVEGFVGVSGGNRWAYDLGVGIVGMPRIRVAPDRAAAVQRGLVGLPGPLVRLTYGTHIKAALDVRGVAVGCKTLRSLEFGTPLQCTRAAASAGMSLERDLGRFSPWIRAGVDLSFSRSAPDLKEDGTPVEALENGTAIGLGTALGVRWRVGRAR